MTPDRPSDPPLHELETPNGPLYVADVGVGPVVLALHGVPGTHRDFRWLASGLEPSLRLVRPDLPGFGATPLATLPARSAHERADLVPLILDALGIERCVVLGHSLGAAITVAAATRFPDRVAAIALLSSPGPRPHRTFRWSRPQLLSWLLEGGLTRALFRPLLPHGFALAGFPRSIPHDELVHTLHCFATTDFAGLGREVGGLSVPALVAWADDDPMIEAEIFAELSALAPAGPRLHFPRGGHNVQKTHAVELSEALIPFARAAW